MFSVPENQIRGLRDETNHHISRIVRKTLDSNNDRRRSIERVAEIGEIEY